MGAFRQKHTAITAISYNHCELAICVCVYASVLARALQIKIIPIIIERTNAPTNDVRNSNDKKSEKRKCNSINHAIVCGHRSAGRHVKYVRPAVSILNQASPNKFRIRLLSIKARRRMLLNLFDPMKLSTTAFKEFPNHKENFHNDPNENRYKLRWLFLPTSIKVEIELSKNLRLLHTLQNRGHRKEILCQIHQKPLIIPTKWKRFFP